MKEKKEISSKLIEPGLKKDVKKVASKKIKTKIVHKPKKETLELPKSLEVNEVKTIPKTSGKYLEAVGRRKTAIARVRLFPGQSGFIVNGKEMEKYFSRPIFYKMVNLPIVRIKPAEKFAIEVKVSGGGVNAQAEAIRHGISRALVLFNSEFKTRLKKLGFITRDPRAKERRKYGLKKARRAPQWAKR
jgi:small subunit ribosomal protein S9